MTPATSPAKFMERPAARCLSEQGVWVGIDAHTQFLRSLLAQNLGSSRQKMVSIRSLLSQSFSNWNEDNATRLGAALAFYTVLSISPLVIFAIALVSLVVSRSSAHT